MRIQIFVAILACIDAAAQAESGGVSIPSGPSKPKVERLGGDRFRLGKIEFDQRTREISFDARVNMNVGVLEYLLVNEMTGKIHESLLTTAVSPLNLNVVLLLLGYEESDALEKDTKDVAVSAQAKASVDIVVKWKDTNGKDREAFIENWINNLATDSPAKRGHWLYTGSAVDGRGGFAAETDGSLVAIYRDHRAVLNNPREGKTSDEIWKPAKSQGLPPKETVVQVVVRPHPVAKPPVAETPRTSPSL